jgi:hypothetical protein
VCLTKDPEGRFTNPNVCLRVRQAEKPEVEAVLKDLDAAFGSMKGSIKEELQAKLRDEAQEPTREAIQVGPLMLCEAAL